MYQFQFEYNFKDLLTLNRVYTKARGCWSARILRTLEIVIGALNLLAVVMFWNAIDAFPRLLVNLIFGLLLVGIGVFRTRLNAWSSKRMLVKDTGVLTVTLDEDGVREHNKKGEGIYRWDALVDGYHSRERYLLFVDKKHAIVLPERALTQGDSTQLKSFIEARLGQEIKEIH